MENNYDALSIIFKINQSDDKEILLKFAYDYWRSGENIQRSLVRGWNSFITLGGDSWRTLSSPSEDFIKEVNHLYKSIRRKKIIGDLINE